jgi:murein L,D-transpeptidase YcbB/YkuD
VLQKALEDNRIAVALNDLLPQQPGYARLKRALQQYENFAGRGGWPMVPKGPKMQKGHRDSRVIALRGRLRAEDFLQEGASEQADLFDEALDESVRRFQSRNGLLEDGVVGRATLEALNISADERVRQIRVNLERWRWLPSSLGKRYVIVNIAGFDLAVIENSQEVLAMRVVVGRDYRRTPVFSGQITYLVLNPYWEVPPKIAIEDKIPLLRTDPEYFAKEKIKVLRGWGSKAEEADPLAVDWSQVTETNFSYRLRQEPGPWNALGRIKFMFPNKFHVYLHDTPTRDLFARSERTFSSGCIRVEKAIDLAAYLLREDPKWTRKNILAAIDEGNEQTVRLPEPMPIHLLYCTAWVDENDVVYFRKDIYGRDKMLSDALEEIHPHIP